jgi:hypothetical protein
MPDAFQPHGTILSGSMFGSTLHVKMYRPKILFIARYVDEILIIFDAANITAESNLEDHNAMHQKLKYKMETESNQQINFLDLNI